MIFLQSRPQNTPVKTTKHYLHCSCSSKKNTNQNHKQKTKTTKMYLPFVARWYILFSNNIPEGEGPSISMVVFLQVCICCSSPKPHSCFGAGHWHSTILVVAIFFGKPHKTHAAKEPDGDFLVSSFLRQQKEQTHELRFVCPHEDSWFQAIQAFCFVNCCS